jgi:putative component of membrane protein insertase Oxa1/YidC/SpoIIIJ protein YidD
MELVRSEPCFRGAVMAVTQSIVQPLSQSLSQSLSQPITRTAIAALNAYQIHLSPHKGFACPHRLLYGGESCSEYVKQRLLQQDLLTAIRTAPPRFRACQAAAVAQSSGSGCIVIPCCIPL